MIGRIAWNVCGHTANPNHDLAADRCWSWKSVSCMGPLNCKITETFITRKVIYKNWGNLLVNNQIVRMWFVVKGSTPINVNHMPVTTLRVYIYQIIEWRLGIEFFNAFTALPSNAFCSPFKFYFKYCTCLLQFLLISLIYQSNFEEWTFGTIS